MRELIYRVISQLFRLSYRLLLIVVGVAVYIVLRGRTVYETEYKEEAKADPGSIGFTGDQELMSRVFYENPANDNDCETITALGSDCEIGDVSGMVAI
jgi:hypothetical protein